MCNKQNMGWRFCPSAGYECLNYKQKVPNNQYNGSNLYLKSLRSPKGNHLQLIIWLLHMFSLKMQLFSRKLNPSNNVIYLVPMLSLGFHHGLTCVSLNQTSKHEEIETNIMHLSFVGVTIDFEGVGFLKWAKNVTKSIET
jgi:hypothetical protein